VPPLLRKIVERRVNQVVRDRMTQEPVIILQGPRTVGKSTLLKSIAASLGKGVVDLDDLPTRDAVRADPSLFVRSPAPVLIDEFQHVPEILDAIKAELNMDSRPGRFVITGSTRYSTLPATAQALTGRIHRVDVRPLSQGEVAERQEEFAETLLEDPARLTQSSPSTTARDDYVRRVVSGGFPLALRRPKPSDRARWFDDYVALVMERDVLEISRVRQRVLLPRLLRQLASQTGQILNIAKAASEIGMEKSTAENYTKLLEAVFLLQQLPAWGTTLGSRVGAAPKIHVLDSGLAARLLRLTESKLAAASVSALTEFGHLLETFVVGEVSKQLDWLEEPAIAGHWRTHDGDEVDLVAERGDGKVAAVEVTAASRVSGDALKAMFGLRRRLGAHFLGGAILYTGVRSYTHEERVHVVPVDRLWKTTRHPNGNPDRDP
jgi:uncharacterized protein